MGSQVGTATELGAKHYYCAKLHKKEIHTNTDEARLKIN